MTDPLREALEYVRNDLSYRAPEMVDPDVREKYMDRIERALAATTKPAAVIEAPKYSYSTDEESYRGDFDSREAAAGEAFDDDEARYCWTGRAVRPSVEQYVDARHVLELMGENAAEECGECVDEWPKLTAEQQRELERRIAAYVIEVAPPMFWSIEDTQRHERDPDDDEGGASCSNPTA